VELGDEADRRDCVDAPKAAEQTYRFTIRLPLRHLRQFLIECRQAVVCEFDSTNIGVEHCLVDIVVQA